MATVSKPKDAGIAEDGVLVARTTSKILSVPHVIGSKSADGGVGVFGRILPTYFFFLFVGGWRTVEG